MYDSKLGTSAKSTPFLATFQSIGLLVVGLEGSAGSVLLGLDRRHPGVQLEQFLVASRY
jgi:hypothetical protein